MKSGGEFWVKNAKESSSNSPLNIFFILELLFCTYNGNHNDDDIIIIIISIDFIHVTMDKV